MTIKPEDNYTSAEVAGYLKVKPNRVHELARLRILPCFYLGRQLRFSGTDLLQFIRNGGKKLDGEGGWRHA